MSLFSWEEELWRYGRDVLGVCLIILVCLQNVRKQSCVLYVTWLSLWLSASLFSVKARRKLVIRHVGGARQVRSGGGRR